MKKLSVLLVSGFVVLVSVVVIRTLLHTPQDLDIAANLVNVSADEMAIVAHMSEAVQFRTVSYQSKSLPVEEFEGFIGWVETTYPEVHTTLEVKRLGEYTLFYKWPGANESLQPILLTAHYDVVPVIPGTEDKWTHPPFDGVVADGYLWGRGSLDDKSAVITLLEATTQLLKEGYQPDRTIYFSFGHDEELGGPNGAGSVVTYAQENNIEFLWSLDEGSFLFKNMIPGVSKLMGTINVAEKGSLTLDIVAKAAGGHSSMPTPDNAVGTLARAITRLEAEPVPGGLDGLSMETFDAASRHMSFGMRMLFANQWLFKDLLEDRLFAITFMNASLRTTTAPTMLSASTKVNVLPIEAVATVNFRLHPRDTVESVIAHVERVVGNDNVEVRPRGGRSASNVSDSNGPGYKVVELSVKEIEAEAFMTPGLMIAGSDSRHYGKVSQNSYRFNPLTVTSADLTKFHGTDENVSIANLVLATKIYTRIIQNGGRE
jgi:carboxypeptidase PM20D1